MRAGTHIVVAVLFGLITDLFLGVSSLLVFYGLIMFSFLLPDIDYAKSTLGRWTPLVGLFVGHRGFFHSLWALLGFSVLAYITSPSFFLPVAIGYGSHLLADMLNPKGILLFHPFGKKICRRIRTGSLLEFLFFVMLVACAGLLAYVQYA
jgi:membrane-bound metal-dependent hydrolase YbcI (DUF457 family)